MGMSESQLESKIIECLLKWNDIETIHNKEDKWKPKIKINERKINLIEFLKKDINYKTGEYLLPENINNNSKFINIEGIDNSGKTMVLNNIKENYPDFCFTSEPVDSDWIGKQVRKSISSKDIDPFIIFYLFLADHVNHLNKTLLPKLEKGNNIVCDRYTFSRYAYQSYTLEEEFEDPMTYLRNIHETGYWSVLPSKTIYLDVSVERSISRMNKNPEIFESEEYLKNIRKNYLDLIDMYENIIVVDTNNKKKKEVLDEVTSIVENIIN